METFLDEVVGKVLDPEIQMTSSFKGRVCRAENTPWNSSEAETNLVSMRTENEVGGRRAGKAKVSVRAETSHSEGVWGLARWV